jgi:hypothetical protein
LNLYQNEGADDDNEDSEDPKDENASKEKEIVEKLGLWLPKEMLTHSPRSQTDSDSNHRTSSLVLAGDRKANLLAKLRELDDEHGVPNSKQVTVAIISQLNNLWELLAFYWYKIVLKAKTKHHSPIKTKITLMTHQLLLAICYKLFTEKVLKVMLF